MDFLDTPTPNTDPIQHTQITHTIPLNLIQNINELSENEQTKITCHLCKGIIKLPVIQCSCCKGIACSLCVENQLNKELTCPFKKECQNYENFPYYNNPDLDPILRKISIKCLGSLGKEGKQCQELIKYKDYQKHYLECQFVKDLDDTYNDEQLAKNIEKLEQNVENVQIICENRDKQIQIQEDQQKENKICENSQQNSIKNDNNINGNQVKIQYNKGFYGTNCDNMLLSYLKEIKYELKDIKQENKKETQRLQQQIKDLQSQNKKYTQYFSQFIINEISEKIRDLQSQRQSQKSTTIYTNGLNKSPSHHSSISLNRRRSRSYMSQQNAQFQSSLKHSSEISDYMNFNSQSLINSNLTFEENNNIQLNNKLSSQHSFQSDQFAFQLEKKESDISYIQKIDEEIHEITEIQEQSFQQQSKVRQKRNSTLENSEINQNINEILKKKKVIDEKLQIISEEFQELKSDTLQNARIGCNLKYRWKTWEEFTENCGALVEKGQKSNKRNSNTNNNNNNQRFHYNKDMGFFGSRCDKCYQKYVDYKKSKYIIANKIQKLKEEKDKFKLEIKILKGQGQGKNSEEKYSQGKENVDDGVLVQSMCSSKSPSIKPMKFFGSLEGHTLRN